MYQRLSKRLFLLIFTVLFASSCATTQSLPPEKLIEKNGLVIGSVVSNAATITMLNSRLTEIKIKSLKTNEIYDLNAIGNSKISTITFAGFAPVGYYKIVGMIGRFGNISGGFKDGEELLESFKVEVGRITNLNTLVYQPVGNREVTIVPIYESIDISRIINENYVTIAPRLLSKEPINIKFKPQIPMKKTETYSTISSVGIIGSLIWELSENALKMKKQLQWKNAKNHEQLIEMAKKSTISMNGRFFSKDGKVYIGSKLGQINIRDASGGWSSIDTGYIDEIIYIFKKENRIIASFDNGRVIISDDNGNNWSQIQEPNIDKFGSTFHISEATPGKYIFATRLCKESGVKINVYKTHITSGGFSYKFMKSIKQDLSNIITNQVGFRKDTVVRTQNKLLIAKDANTIEIYDVKNDKWLVHETLEEYAAIRTNNKGDVIFLTDNDGIVRSHSISTDEGESWIPINGIPHMSFDLHFSDSSTAYGRAINMGAFSSSTSVIRSYDGGETWDESSEMKHYCIDFLIVDKSKEMLCSAKSGALMSTKDGDKWVVERAVF